MTTLFCLQAEEGIRDLVRSRGLGDVYKRQGFGSGRAASLRGNKHRGSDTLQIAGADRKVLAMTLSLIHI